MDELELLKKDWQKGDTNYKKLSSKDIYPMLLKKSSSIVKTLFYISVGELILWLAINSIPYFSSAEYKAELEALYGSNFFVTGITIFSYIVILLFVYLLYESYKTISVTDNAKKLMESILKTRKIIKYYVLYNLIMAFVTMIVALYFSIHNNSELAEKIATQSNTKMFAFWAIMVLVSAIFVVVIWLFYKLLYGILLKRLNRNYNELKKLEV